MNAAAATPKTGGTMPRVRTIPPTSRPPSRGRVVVPVMGTVLLAVVGGHAWIVGTQLDRSLVALDIEAVQQAGAALSGVLDRQKAQALSEIQLLTGDNRIRATVITDHFDEATVSDVLDDVQKASGASTLAVLDPAGKVRAVSGIASLEKMDLGQAAAVRAALEKPTADIWSFPQHALAVAVAPIVSGDRVAALLMIGFELGPATLAPVERALGVDGALVLGDRMVTGSTDATVKLALWSARSAPETPTRVVAGGQAFVVKASLTDKAATAARVVWLVPRNHQAALVGSLPEAVWLPVGALGLMLLLSIVVMRRG